MLLKDGTGTLTLTGQNSFPGITVNTPIGPVTSFGVSVGEGGILRVAGSVAGGGVIVNEGAAFATGGDGAYIEGRYDAEGFGFAGFWDGAITAIQIGAPLYVDGEANIDGGRLHLLPPVASYTVQPTELLIHTTQGLNGRFYDLTYGSNFFWTAELNYTETELTATMTPSSGGGTPPPGGGDDDDQPPPPGSTPGGFADGSGGLFYNSTEDFTWNSITGYDSLTHIGIGTLTLVGDNVFTDEVILGGAGGTLRVAGNLKTDMISQPMVTNTTFATGGNGAFIDGSYDGSARFVNGFKITSPTTAIQIGAPLVLTGTANVSDARLRLLPPLASYTVQPTELLISAAGGLSGRFAELTYGSNFFWTATLNYGANDLTATMTATGGAQALARSRGSSARVVAGAGMADALIRHATGLVNSGQSAGHEAVLSATGALMAAPDDDRAALSLASLTGEIHGTARALGIQRALDGGERTANRLRTLARGTRTTGLWTLADSGNGHLNRAGYGDAEVHHSTAGVGLDERLGDAWTVGLSAARMRSNAHLDVFGGHLRGSGQQMAVYARRDIGNSGYLTGLVSHDRHTVDTRRRVLTATILNTVTGQHTDHATLARLETGFALHNGLTPYLAAGSLTLRQGRFSESGVLGLSAAADAFTARFVDIGSRFDRTAGHWTFGSHLTARRMFGGDAGFNAAFAGAEAAAFTLAGQPLTRTSVRFGSDVAYRAGNGWNLSFGFGADRGQGQRTNTWGEAALGLNF